MRKTLGELLRPSFDCYRSVGEQAYAVQQLLSTARDYRDQGRWGTSGPTEILSGYGSCTNCSTQPWHSGRITQGDNDNVATWQEIHDQLYKCILESLCDTSFAVSKWKQEHNIGFALSLKMPAAYQHHGQERVAWEAVRSLHKLKLPVESFNDCHRETNVLCAPELFISPKSICVSLQVTLASELRSSPVCYSRWNVCRLVKQKEPQWQPHHETFAEFLLRSVEFFKQLKPKATAK